MALKEILQKQKSLVDFLETNFGHLSILNPRFSEFFDDRSENDDGYEDADFNKTTAWRNSSALHFDHIDYII